MSGQARVCPQCGVAAVVPILYGEPTWDANAAACAGKARLGGCLVFPGAPDSACNHCGLEWNSKKSLGQKDYADIEHLQAGVGGYWGPSYDVRIDFLSGKASWKKSERYEVEDERARVLNRGEIAAFVENLRDCDLLNWERDYSWPACDGTQWSVRISFADATMAKSGSNAYPETWEQFCRAIGELVGGEFR